MAGKKKACTECGRMIPAKTMKCKGCGAGQEKKCIECGAVLLPGTRYCTNCKTYQDFRRYLVAARDFIVAWKEIFLTVSALLALLTLLGFKYCQKPPGPSNTSFKVIGATESLVILRVSNNGGGESTLTRFVLEFSDLPLENASLELLGEDKRLNAIPAGAVTLRLRVPGLATTLKNDPCAKETIRSSIGSQGAKLYVYVRESDNREHIQQDRVPVQMIRHLILRRLPDDRRCPP